MIYSKEDELIDCEYVRKKEFVNGFLNQFFNEISTARARNFTTPTNYHKLVHQSMSGDGEMMEMSDAAAMDAFGMRNLEYKQIRDENDVPADILPLMNYNNLKRQCDNRHRQMKRIVHDMNSEHPENRKNATEHLNR